MHRLIRLGGGLLRRRECMGVGWGGGKSQREILGDEIHDDLFRRRGGKR